MCLSSSLIGNATVSGSIAPLFLWGLWQALTDLSFPLHCFRLVLVHHGLWAASFQKIIFEDCSSFFVSDFQLTQNVCDFSVKAARDKSILCSMSRKLDYLLIFKTRKKKGLKVSLENLTCFRSIGCISVPPALHLRDKCFCCLTFPLTFLRKMQGCSWEQTADWWLWSAYLLQLLKLTVITGPLSRGAFRAVEICRTEPLRAKIGHIWEQLLKPWTSCNRVCGSMHWCCEACPCVYLSLFSHLPSTVSSGAVPLVACAFVFYV